MSLVDDKKVHSRTVIPVTGKAELTLGKEVMMKIHYLHQRVTRNTEWSGVLMYKTVSGGVEDPGNWKLEADDFILMDVGTGSYTEYDFDTDDVYSFDKYTDAMLDDKRLGHIHTHHSMDTFFSGTDMSELHENAPNHAYYLSLIVNYKEPGLWMAKVAFVGEETSVGSIVRTKNSILNMLGFGEPVEEVVNKVTPILYTIDCDLIIADEMKPFYDRVTEICKPKVVATPYRYTPPGHYNGTSMHQQRFKGANLKKKKATKMDWSDWDARAGVAPSLFNQLPPNKVVQKRTAGSYSIAAIYPFVCKLISTNLNEGAETTITQLFKTIGESSEVEIEFLVDVMEEEFEKFLATHFNVPVPTQLDLFCVSIGILKVCETYVDTYLYQCMDNMLDVYTSIKIDADFKKKVTQLTNIENLAEWTAVAT